MNRYISVLILVFLICISPASAWGETWQKQVTIPPEYTTWAYISGAASYGLTNAGTIYTDDQYATTSITCGIYYSTDWCGFGIYKNNPEPTTYVGWTDNIGEPYIFVGIADAGKTWDWFYSGSRTYRMPISGYGTGRYEYKWYGGNHTIWFNGDLKVTGLGVGSAFANPPHYVSIGSTYTFLSGGTGKFDNIVYGTTDPHYIIGTIPPTFYIQQNPTNPALDGLYNGAGVLVNSNTFRSTYAKADNTTPMTISVHNMATGTEIESQTVTAMSGIITHQMTKYNSTSGAAQGMYRVEIDGTAAYDTFMVEVNGATVAWDRSDYSVGDSANISYTVSPTWWNTATYDYELRIIDAFGNEVYSDPVLVSTGNRIVVLSSDDYSDGLYFATIEATVRSSGVVYTMGYDYASIVDYLIFNGYVLNAETGSTLANATINVTQTGRYSQFVSLGDGAWNSSNSWLPNFPITITTNRTGYTIDNVSFTALASRSINLNISLMPFPPTMWNVTLAGIVREKPYYQPVESATVIVQNTSIGTCTATTNIAGFYRCGTLVNGSWYDVWGSKTMYVNSTVSSVFVSGV